MKTSKTPRLRVLRAIEPNAGLRVECAKKVGNALKDLSGTLSAQALECFREGDAFMSRPDFLNMVAAEMRRMPEAEGMLGQFTADAAPPELAQDAWLTQRQRNVLKACAHLFHAPGKFAVQSAQGLLKGLSARSGNHFSNGFGLAQVHAAVEKGPVGKFAPAGRHGTGSKQGLQDGGDNELASMAVYFRTVFARVGPWARHVDTEHLVKPATCVIMKGAVIESPGHEIREIRSGWRKKQAQELVSHWAGKSDDGNGPIARGRGLCGNGGLPCGKIVCCHDMVSRSSLRRAGEGLASSPFHG